MGAIITVFSSPTEQHLVDFLSLMPVVMATRKGNRSLQDDSSDLLSEKFPSLAARQDQLRRNLNHTPLGPTWTQGTRL